MTYPREIQKNLGCLQHIDKILLSFTRKSYRALAKMTDMTNGLFLRQSFNLICRFDKRILLCQLFAIFPLGRKTQGNITAGAFTAADSVGNIYVQGHED